MGSKSQPLRDIGIYHNLPTFDPSISGLTAIITGANGISGFGTLRALLDSPERWTKIYALSRRPPPQSMMNLLTPEQRARVQHVACDFLTSPQQIADALNSANVQASHIYFYSYLQPAPPPGQPIWANSEELVTFNTALLSNFLSALPLANINPSRIVLQTGSKNYGMHIGRARQPALESDPQPKHLSPPNFYYPQEDLLFDFCRTHPNTSWNVIRPHWVIGAATTAAMNAFHPYAVYAVVQARKHKPIAFPSTFDLWTQSGNYSTARLTGYLTEWASLEPECANQSFNAADTSPFTADRFYEQLVKWYGVDEGITPPETDDSKFRTITGRSGKDTPMGYGPPTVVKFSFTFVDWAKDPENVAVWEELMKESGGKLTDNPFKNPEESFGCADMVWLRLILSMDKARKLGWNGYVDTMEGIKEMYEEMVGLGMVPAMRV